MYIEIDDCDKALEDSDEAIRLDPEMDDAYFNRGRCRLLEGDIPGGMRDLKQCVRLNPEHDRCWKHLAEVYILLEEYDAAYEAGFRASELDTVNTEYLEVTGVALVFLKRYDEAHLYFDRILAIDPEHEDIWAFKADVYRASGDADSTMYSMERALEQSPENTNYLGNVAFLKAEAEEFEDAAALFERLIELSDANPYIFNNYGYVLFRTGKTDEAIQMIAQSLRMDSENSYAYRNLALIHIAENDTDKACRMLDKALDLDFTEKYGNEVQLLKEKHCSK